MDKRAKFVIAKGNLAERLNTGSRILIYSGAYQILTTPAGLDVLGRKAARNKSHTAKVGPFTVKFSGRYAEEPVAPKPVRLPGAPQ